MMILRGFQTTFVVLALTTVVHAQQVASKDLVRSPAAVMATIPAQTEQELGHAKGCAEMGAGFVDGVTLNEDKRTRKLKVGLVKISTTKLVIGTEIIATAKLQICRVPNVNPRQTERHILRSIGDHVAAPICF
jgi:hypothetical protein